MIDTELLAVLACPCCKGKLEIARPDGGGEGLLCSSCSLVFPSEGGIQILLKEEAIPRLEWEAGRRKNKARP